MCALAIICSIVLLVCFLRESAPEVPEETYVGVTMCVAHGEKRRAIKTGLWLICCAGTGKHLLGIRNAQRYCHYFDLPAMPDVSQMHISSGLFRWRCINFGQESMQLRTLNFIWLVVEPYPSEK